MPYRHLAGLSKRRNEVCVHTENNKKQNCFCTLTLPYPNTHPPNGSCYFEPNLFPYHFLFLVHSTHIYLPMKMEQTECSETSAYKLQTPGNYPKENIQHTEHGESLKSRKQIAKYIPTTYFGTFVIGLLSNREVNSDDSSGRAV